MIRHRQHIIEILNNFQNADAYKLHADKDVAKYLKYLEPRVFGEYYDHICTIRCILTLLARHMSAEGNLSPEKLLEINREIAAYAGYLPCRS